MAGCRSARVCPESGTFTHESVFDVRWLSSVGGGWERKPTQEELTTLRYAKAGGTLARPARLSE
jgi:hypothetical protein